MIYPRENQSSNPNPGTTNTNMKMDNHTIKPFVKSEYLTIGQLASNFGWSVRFIEGLVRGERLPGMQIDGIWYFRREEVIDWLASKIQTLEERRVIELEKHVESSLVADGIYQRPFAPDRLASRLPLEGIALNVAAGSKPEVLRMIAALAERTGLVYDRNYLLASLFDRESVCSTAMPEASDSGCDQRTIHVLPPHQRACGFRCGERRGNIGVFPAVRAG